VGPGKTRTIFGQERLVDLGWEDFARIEDVIGVEQNFQLGGGGGTGH